MPAFNLTRQRAQSLWTDNAAGYQQQIASLVGLLPTDQIVDWIVGEMIQLAIREAPRAWAWFAQQAAALRARLEAAADRLDDRLKWHNIANEDLRDLFEANDNLYDHFQGGLRVLIRAIESDVAQAELSAGLGLLEGDALAGFFSQPPLIAPLKLDPIEADPDQEITPVDSQREALLLRDKQRAEAALAEAEAAREDAETRAAAAEARVDALSALVSAAHIEDESPIVPTDSEPTVVDLGAAEMPFPAMEPTEPAEPANLGADDAPNDEQPSLSERARKAVQANGPLADKQRRERQRQRRGTGKGTINKIANPAKPSGRGK